MVDLKKYIYIKDVLSKDERTLFFNYVKLFNEVNITNFEAKSLGETYSYGDMITDSLLISKKEKFEKAANLKFIETYSYWRLYKKFSSLRKHIDRPSCEITVTVNVKSDIEWPIFIGGEKVLIKPGDGILYYGAKVEHWREEYVGDYALQIFFHYVEENGKFTEYKYDKRENLGTRKI